MKKIISLIVAAILLLTFTAVAEEEGTQTYSWEEYEQLAKLMGAEGNFATYSQFNLKMWIPAEFEQAETIEEDQSAAGYIDFFGSDEHPLAIGVQFTNVGEGIETVEDLLDSLDKEQYDAPTLTRINSYNVLLLTENGGENLIVAISAGDGDFLLIHYFNMNKEQWGMDRSVISMASIQSIEA